MIVFRLERSGYWRSSPLPSGERVTATFPDTLPFEHQEHLVQGFGASIQRCIDSGVASKRILQVINNREAEK